MCMNKFIEIEIRKFVINFVIIKKVSQIYHKIICNKFEIEADHKTIVTEKACVEYLPRKLTISGCCAPLTRYSVAWLAL